MRKGVATPYFRIPRFIGEIQPGPLGHIKRSEKRVHISTDKASKFDKSRFGVTEEDIYRIATWFKDPNHRVLVATGATGAGKTIAVPYWFLYPPQKIVDDFGSDYFTRDGQILLTEPRIIALKKAITFLGELMGSSIGRGQDLGYSYSQEDKSDWRNAIDFTTDGKLVNWIVAGKISQYGFIIVDEAHEGSENIKIILRLLNERMSLYPNLKVVILSATIDTEEFQRYFAGQGASIIEFAGKARYDSKGNEILPPVRHFTTQDESLPYEDPTKLAKPLMQKAKEKAQWLVEEIVSGRKEWGDILILLHGKNPINQLVKDLQAWAGQEENLSRIVEVYPLYRTENDEEDLTAVADEDPSPGKIRIIVSTNIAEASVTIDSLVYEIETGVQIQPQFKAEIGANEYPVTLISRANATQRFGRVGRTKNGEVYTLYTEQQFNELFREQPLDVLERSNLEDVLLKVKAAGISNVQTGWLGNAPKEEIDRSTKQLVDSNILTAEGSLTSYGALVRIFSYPPRLIDMLMAADDLGCSVEMATILPVIKNDGTRRLLSWRFSWDAYTKRIAFKRHSALMAGCKDDMEFILKLYKAWGELPWLDQNQLRELSKEELNTLRKQWADIHFVNHKVLLVIAKDRDEALERLGVSTKEEGSRSINLSQISRVRTLLRSMLTETEVSAASNPYRYVADIEPQAGTLATCSLISDEQRAVKSDSWLEIPALEEETDGTFSRFFIDQVYPVGYRFAAKLEQQGDGFAWIKTTRNLTRAQALAQQTVTLAEEEPEDLLEDEILEVEEPEEASGISLADIPIQYWNVDCKQAVRTASSLVGEVIVEITDFYFEEGQVPVVIAEVVPQPEPFDVFVKRHRYSDEVTVEVREILQFEGDYSAALVVRDIETNLEVLVEPQDMSFTRQAQAVTQIPVGARLILNVENIDLETRRVRLTNWEKVENTITDRFITTEGDDETTIAKATVVDIHDDGKVMFALDLGQATLDICIIISVYGIKLPKNSSEFKIGEQATLKVYRRSKASSYADLPSLPSKAVSKISSEERPNELSWKRGVLRFTGRMTYDRLYEFRTIADRDLDFQRALEKLYWHSNFVYAAQFVDSELFTHLQTTLAVGTTINNAIVVEINNGGVVVELGRGLKGFVPRSKIMEGRGNLIDFVTVGSTVQVRVLEHRIERAQPLLEIIGGIVNPLEQLVVGRTYKGIVEEVNQNGVFVNLSPTITGRVKHNEVYRGGTKTEDLFKAGDNVIVKVLSVHPSRHSVELSMKIPEYDPSAKLKQGAIVEGIVASQQSYGYFITIAMGIDGLLRHENIPEVSTGFLGLGGKAKPNIAVGMKLQVKIIAIGPDRKNPAKTVYGLEYVRQLK
ncbi:MAG: S1 RNA-binding domain-containing protein [Candidatus Woesebacteria bacterium]|nr:MAG: S1 RNA-binding domain-containing protein [Candidatus Woesebacteria bacterium]